MSISPNGSIRSVDKALDIIEALSRESRGLPLTEIARRLQFNVSTTHHLLATLRRRGFVHQDEHTKVYRLGYWLIGLVNEFLAETDLYSAGLGPTRELRDLSGEMSYLTVLHGREMVAVIEMVGWKPVQCRRTRLHGETCLHCTASGKVLLAYLPREHVDPLLSSLTLTKFTPNTISNLDELQAELAAIRRQGYVLDREENLEGVMCVAAPVLGSQGECVAAASVAFPSAGAGRTNELIRLVLDAATKISRSLGYVPRAPLGQVAVGAGLPVGSRRNVV